jgi:O-acetyl-ADP-ribose deacetylase (regulator of RNase III)
MKLTVHQGDITQLRVDAIVNAANRHLLPGGGVCGAIHRAAGPGLEQECARYIADNGAVTPGSVVATTAHLLPCRHVIHAVGPVWLDGKNGEPAILHSAYLHSLRLAGVTLSCRTIAFPCISTGIYGYPPDAACGVALMAVADFARMHPDAIEEVTFCCFSHEDAERYRKALGVQP